MVLDFVSLVPAGDDPLAQVVISKAAPDTITGGTVDPISKDDLDPEVVTYIDGLETEVTDLTKSVEDLTAEKDALTTEKTEVEKRLKEAEDNGLIVKSEDEQRAALIAKADPAVRALIEKAEQSAKEASEIAKAERDARLDREFISKAESMPMLAEDKTEFGTLLRKAHEALGDEDFGKFEQVLKTANEQIAKGNLFSEFGHGGGETTISKSVEAAAAEITKAEPTLTREQAIAKAYEANPALLAADMTQEG
jgi:chromosome segregation ATPase